MRLERIIILAAIAGLIFSATGCAITSGSGDSAQADEIVDEIDVDSGDNPFFVPSDDDAASGDDTVIVDNAAPSKQIPIEVKEVKFVTEVEELEGLTFKLGEDVEKLIEVKGGSGEGFTWSYTGLPAGLDMVNYNQSASKVMIKGVLDMADALGEHHVTLTATDVGGDKESASISFKLVVEMEPIEPKVFEDPCSQPLKIEVVRNGEYGDIYDGESGQVEGERANADTIIVPVGAKNHEILLKVTGGKAPYTWTWESKVEHSAHCRIKDEYMDLMNKMGKYWNYVEEQDIQDRKLCEQLNHYGNGYYYFKPGAPQWTQNTTWHLEGEDRGVHKDPVPVSDPFEPRSYYADSDSSSVVLSGDFRYDGGSSADAGLGYGPLPVTRKYIEDEGRWINNWGGDDDLNVLPVESLRITVRDSCQAGRMDETHLRFKLEHKREDLENVKVSILWKNLKRNNEETSECTGDDRCKQFDKPNISFFFLDDDDMEWDIEYDPSGESSGYKSLTLGSEILDAADLRSLFDSENLPGYVVFKMKHLEENADWADIGYSKFVNKTRNNATVKDISTILLRVDTPQKAADDLQKLEILKVRIESKQWYAEVRWNEGVKREWNRFDYKQLTGFDPLFFRFNSSSSASQLWNSEGWLFRRKAMPSYN